MERTAKGERKKGVKPLLQNRRSELGWLLIVLLFAFLFYIFVSSYAFDDLGFDFAGYALRYKLAFSGWIKNLLLGVPSATFDGIVPPILPIIIRFFGIGSFTLPLATAIFLLQLLVPIVFVFIGRLFGIGKKKSLLIGLLFVLNPFTFKFFNRYYEFTAWVFFLISFYFFCRFLEAKRFERRYFALSVLASAAIVLSHPSVIIFWFIAFALSVLDFVDLKRFAAVAFFTFGLAAFWLLPFFSFANLSVVSEQKGADLATIGIKAAGYFFAIAMPVVLVAFANQLKQNQRLFRLFFAATVLAIVYAVAPKLPMLNVPFAHSFHAFSVFALALATMQLIKVKALQRKHLAAIGIAAIACAVLLFPVVARQYFFTEPRYSSYQFEGQRINFKDIDALLQKIPKDSRFETLPYDPIISAYSTFNYDLLSLRGWGYNAYALKGSEETGERLASMNIFCDEFVSGSEKTATKYWIALNETGAEFLKQCGLKKVSGNLPGLFLLDSNKAGLVYGAELLEFENNFIKFKAREKRVLVKTSWFPRWKATANGRELAIENAKPGMLLQTEPGAIVEMRYGSTNIDLIGIVVSIIVLLLFALAIV